MNQKILTMLEKEFTRYNIIKEYLEKKLFRAKASGALNIRVFHVKQNRYSRLRIQPLHSCF